MGEQVYDTEGTYDLVVPANVTEMTFTLRGGGIGAATARPDALLVPAVPVTPGETLRVVVGGAAHLADGTGGFNGGGDGAVVGGATSAGGGATDVRRAGTGTEHRVMVAPGDAGPPLGAKVENPRFLGGDHIDAAVMPGASDAPRAVLDVDLGNGSPPGPYGRPQVDVTAGQAGGEHTGGASTSSYNATTASTQWSGAGGGGFGAGASGKHQRIVFAPEDEPVAPYAKEPTAGQGQFGAHHAAYLHAIATSGPSPVGQIETGRQGHSGYAKITWDDPSPLAPTAVVEPSSVRIRRRPITLSGAASTDPDGTIVDYSWWLGIDTTGLPDGTGDTFTFTPYDRTFVTLQVTDDDGLTATAVALVALSSGWQVGSHAF